MANVKKDSAVSTEEEITREENVKTKKDTKIEELEKANKELKDQMAQIMEMLRQSQAAPVATKTEVPADVTIVHLVQRAPGLSTYIKLSNLDIVLTTFGEEFSLTPQQFDELAGKYRKLFETGVLAVGDNCEYYAQRKKLKCANTYHLNFNLFSELAHINAYDLESIYNQVEKPLKKSIAEYFKQRIIANDPAFKDIRKIEVLNRLTDGGFSIELQNFNR